MVIYDGYAADKHRYRSELCLTDLVIHTEASSKCHNSWPTEYRILLLLAKDKRLSEDADLWAALLHASTTCPVWSFSPYMFFWSSRFPHNKHCFYLSNLIQKNLNPIQMFLSGRWCSHKFGGNNWKPKNGELIKAKKRRTNNCTWTNETARQLCFFVPVKNRIFFVPYLWPTFLRDRNVTTPDRARRRQPHVHTEPLDSCSVVRVGCYVWF